MATSGHKDEGDGVWSTSSRTGKSTGWRVGGSTARPLHPTEEVASRPAVPLGAWVVELGGCTWTAEEINIVRACSCAGENAELDGELVPCPLLSGAGGVVAGAKASLSRPSRAWRGPVTTRFLAESARLRASSDSCVILASSNAPSLSGVGCWRDRVRLPRGIATYESTRKFFFH